jgi:hypothetical protein
MRLLAVPHKAYGTVEQLSEHIRSAMARGLPEFSPGICSHDGTLVIVGSGPSMPNHFDEIQKERERGRPICALNGAHDFLCGNNFIPDLFLSVDPRETIIGNTKHRNDTTIYLIASRCNPKLFDHLKDCKVILWHSWSPDAESEAFKGKMAIGGGTTSGTRSIYVGYVLGFRKFVLYGLDSCLASDGITKRFSGEKAGRVVDIYVGERGRKFLANVPMAQQAEEIQDAFNHLGDASFEFVGDGLLAAIWEERKRRGLRT